MKVEKKRVPYIFQRYGLDTKFSLKQIDALWKIYSYFIGIRNGFRFKFNEIHGF